MQRYISNELTHFVGRGKTPDEQYKILTAILREGRLYRPGTSIDGDAQFFRPRVNLGDDNGLPIVCFCDIPTGDFAIHMSKYSCFGLSFSKRFLVERGANPVFYLSKDSTIQALQRVADDSEEVDFKIVRMVDGVQFLYRSTSKSRLDYFDEMVDIVRLLMGRALKDLGDPISMIIDFPRLVQFLNVHVFSFIKPFDDKLDDSHLDNYYMEREWRVVGEVTFHLDNVKRIILPSEQFGMRFRQDFPTYSGQVTFLQSSTE